MDVFANFKITFDDEDRKIDEAVETAKEELVDAAENVEIESGLEELESDPVIFC